MEGIIQGHSTQGHRSARQFPVGSAVKGRQWALGIHSTLYHMIIVGKGEHKIVLIAWNPATSRLPLFEFLL